MELTRVHTEATLSSLTGIPLRPWHPAGNVVSLRDFTSTAFNQHHGIQSTERFGIHRNEFIQADVNAATVYSAEKSDSGVRHERKRLSRDVACLLLQPPVCLPARTYRHDF